MPDESSPLLVKNQSRRCTRRTLAFDFPGAHLGRPLQFGVTTSGRAAVCKEVTPIPNTLYYGDNLDILRRYINNDTIDLVYLDPPFNSNATYNVLFAEQDGARAASQIKAFDDTWKWDQAASKAYQETVLAGGKLSDAMQAFHQILGDSNMLAFLAPPRRRAVKAALGDTAAGRALGTLVTRRKDLPSASLTECNV